MIEINPNLHLEEDELEFKFILASGPGGQKVNKTSTAVQLRFKLGANTSLSPEVKLRLRRLAGSRITDQDELVITARNHRTQQRNRQEALDRLLAMIRKALVAPKARRKTRPSRAAREKRLEGKKRQGQKKELRRSVDY